MTCTPSELLYLLCRWWICWSGCCFPAAQTVLWPSHLHTQHTRAEKKQRRVRERSFQPVSDANAILSARPSTTNTLFSICDRSREMDQSVSSDAAPAPGRPQTPIHLVVSNMRHCHTPRLSCRRVQKVTTARCRSICSHIRCHKSSFNAICLNWSHFTRPEHVQGWRQFITQSFFHLRTAAH